MTGFTEAIDFGMFDEFGNVRVRKSPRLKVQCRTPVVRQVFLGHSLVALPAHTRDLHNIMARPSSLAIVSTGSNNPTSGSRNRELGSVYSDCDPTSARSEIVTRESSLPALVHLWCCERERVSRDYAP